MHIDEKLLLEENELKPNNYSARAVLYSFLVFEVVELLNEIGVFHVELFRMRMCFLVASFCTIIIQVIARHPAISQKSITKYFVIALMLLETLSVTIVISQWSELMIALPLMLALQYHNKGITKLAIAGTIVIAIIASPLSIYLDLAQLDFYDFLIRSTGHKIVSIVEDPDYNKWTYIVGSLRYISLPRCGLVIALSAVSVYITRLVSSNVQHRANATYYSAMDIMTGIYNRFSFERKLKNYEQERPEKLICVYADADGLHILNNTKGHDAGDALLKACASQLADNFGELTFRLGGDEFLSFIEDDDVEAVNKKLAEISDVMTEKGYHMSLGMSLLEDGKTIDELVREAEQNMFAAKSDFYVTSGMERRAQR